MARRKNTFAKAVRHLKSTKFDAMEAAPTNSTMGYMASGIAGLPKPDVARTIQPLNLDQDGDGSEDYDGKDTTGLFLGDGTILTATPPGDNSYILGPMAGMFYDYSHPDWTRIGYIRQSDRRMVNLGSIVGKLSDWDGSSDFTSYGQLTLEQAVWFRDVQKGNGMTNDPATYNYRAFYPGPPSSSPDEHGRYYCVIGGTPKDIGVIVPDPGKTEPDLDTMDPGDVLSAILDKLRKGKKITDAEKEWAADHGYEWIDDALLEDLRSDLEKEFDDAKNANFFDKLGKAGETFAKFLFNKLPPVIDNNFIGQDYINGVLDNAYMNDDGTLNFGDNIIGTSQKPVFEGGNMIVNFNYDFKGNAEEFASKEGLNWMQKTFAPLLYAALGEYSLDASPKFGVPIIELIGGAFFSKLIRSSKAFGGGKHRPGQIKIPISRLPHGLRSQLRHGGHSDAIDGSGGDDRAYIQPYNPPSGGDVRALPWKGGAGGDRAEIPRHARPGYTPGDEHYDDQPGNWNPKSPDFGKPRVPDTSPGKGKGGGRLKPNPFKQKTPAEKNREIHNVRGGGGGDKWASILPYNPPSGGGKGDRVYAGGPGWDPNKPIKGVTPGKPSRGTKATLPGFMDRGRGKFDGRMPEVGIPEKDWQAQIGGGSEPFKKGVTPGKPGRVYAGGPGWDPNKPIKGVTPGSPNRSRGPKGDGKMYAGGSPDFDERTGKYRPGTGPKKGVTPGKPGRGKFDGRMPEVGIPEKDWQAQIGGGPEPFKKGVTPGKPGRVYAGGPGWDPNKPIKGVTPGKPSKRGGSRKGKGGRMYAQPYRGKSVARLAASYELEGEVLSESRKSVIKNLKKPVTVPKEQTKFKVKPKVRGLNSAIISKPVDVPKEYQPKGGRNQWGRHEYDFNTRQSQERMNEVLELVGEGEQAFNYMLTDSKKKNAEEMEKFWGLHPELYSYVYNGKKYKELRKEELQGDYIVFLMDEDGKKINMLQSELNEKMAEEREANDLAEYNKIMAKKEPISFEKDYMFKKVYRRLKPATTYKGKPATKGYPDEPPPEMVNNRHPDFGKAPGTTYYNKLDPQSAAAMPKQDDPTIDAKVQQAKDNPKIDGPEFRRGLQDKVKKQRKEFNQEEFSDWRSELTLTNP